MKRKFFLIAIIGLVFQLASLALAGVSRVQVTGPTTGEVLFVTTSGDNYRTIARIVLGDAERWPEIAALNPYVYTSVPIGVTIRVPVKLPSSDPYAWINSGTLGQRMLARAITGQPVVVAPIDNVPKEAVIVPTPTAPAASVIVPEANTEVAALRERLSAQEAALNQERNNLAQERAALAQEKAARESAEKNNTDLNAQVQQLRNQLGQSGQTVNSQQSSIASQQRTIEGQQGTIGQMSSGAAGSISANQQPTISSQQATIASQNEKISSLTNQVGQSGGRFDLLAILAGLITLIAIGIAVGLPIYYRGKLREKDIRYQAEMEKLSQAHKQALDDLKRGQEKEVENLKKKYQDSLVQLTQKHEQQLQRIIENYKELLFGEKVEFELKGGGRYVYIPEKKQVKDPETGEMKCFFSTLTASQGERLWAETLDKAEDSVRRTLTMAEKGEATQEELDLLESARRENRLSQSRYCANVLVH